MIRFFVIYYCITFISSLLLSFLYPCDRGYVDNYKESMVRKLFRSLMDPITLPILLVWIFVSYLIDKTIAYKKW